MVVQSRGTPYGCVLNVQAIFGLRQSRALRNSNQATIPSIHVRVESPLFTHTLFGVYLGVMVWGGLYLRDIRLRHFSPYASTPDGDTS